MTDIEQARKAGQDEAWETARKIFCQYKAEDMEKLFDHIGDVILPWNNTAQEAIQKIKDYEERMNIAIGDVIRDITGDKDEYTIVVTRIFGNTCYGFNLIGVYRSVRMENAIKTGKHFDIQTILDSMGGDV